MSVFDQAFIKAYGCHETGTALCEETSPVPAQEVEPPSGDAVEAIEGPAEAAEAPATDCEPPRSGSFRPMLQVDRFAWPDSAAGLCRLALRALEALTDGLLVGVAQGRNVIALGSCRRGDGATTLLLCIARRLAERGARVVMVEADFRHPRLARRLGILPEIGWDEVLAGRVPLGEAVVESCEDHLALLPLRECPEAQRRPTAESADPAASIAVLRRHYDVVLIDLGSISKAELMLAPAPSTGPWIDRVLVVRNVGVTSPSDFAAACRLVQAAGIQDIGVVENFA